MSLFNPASSPQLMAGGLVVWNNIFTSAELDAMERYGDRLTLEKAELAAQASGRDSIRVTIVRAGREQDVRVVLQAPS